MKREVGRDKGAFDMAPYETRCAFGLRNPAVGLDQMSQETRSISRFQVIAMLATIHPYLKSLAIEVVSFPDTQFRPSKMG